MKATQVYPGCLGLAAFCLHKKKVSYPTLIFPLLQVGRLMKKQLSKIAASEIIPLPDQGLVFADTESESSDSGLEGVAI